MTRESAPRLQAAIAVSRFGLGARPGELADVASDPRGWLVAQITPPAAEQPLGALADSRASFAAYRDALVQVRQFKADERVQSLGPPDGPASGGAMSDTAMSDSEMSGRPQAAETGSRNAGEQLKAERRRLLAPLRKEVLGEIAARTRLAAATRAPFKERWTLFWANHFTVSAAKPVAAPLAGPFEREAIRPHVFGRFEDLLVASSNHPGMLVYLDQQRSAGPDSQAGTRRSLGLNENLAREIMELHTVGPEAGYTQADVTEFARALTGYSIGLDRDGPGLEGGFLFRPNMHEPGVRTVMGRTYADDGQAQARAILTSLAANPHTADHLARKLAIHFVADDPSPALVARLREAYLRSHGDLAVVARALIEAPEAWTEDPLKFKRPAEFLVSAYRAMGSAPADPQREIAAPLLALGELPFHAPQPNGWSDQAGDWAAPDAVVKRLGWSARFAAGAPADAAPLEVADAALGGRLSNDLKTAIARAETRPAALTLLFMSPEFQRR